LPGRVEEEVMSPVANLVVVSLGGVGPRSGGPALGRRDPTETRASTPEPMNRRAQSAPRFMCPWARRARPCSSSTESTYH